MGRIMVSILATYYNNYEYVDEGIQSLLDQECDFEYEIILGDDGSNDGTREKLEKWCEAYPNIMSLHVMERDNNKQYLGPVRASRNRLNLLQYVKGKYFMYFDGDDYYIDSHKLQEQVDVLESHPECIACGHRVKVLDHDSIKSFIPPKTSSFEKELWSYWLTDYLHTNSLMFRAECKYNINTDVLRDFFNDNCITYSMIQSGKVFYLPKSMSVYRWTGQGIYTNSSEVVKHLREIMSFDIERRINKSMWLVSCFRHRKHLLFFRNYHRNKQDVAVNDDTMKKWKELIDNNDLALTTDCYNYVFAGTKSRRLRSFMFLASIMNSICSVLLLFVKKS